MKIEKIKFSRYFHPINPGEWCGMDIILEDGDDPMVAFAKAREIAQAAYNQGKKEVSDEGLPVIQVRSPVQNDLDLDGNLVKDMLHAKTLDNLRDYLPLTINSDELKGIYEACEAKLLRKNGKHSNT